MLGFVVRRVLLGLVVIVGVLTVTFVVGRIVPSDPARLYAGSRATPEDLAKVTRELGLDRPLYEQYFTYMRGVLTGDLGRSLMTKTVITEDIKVYLPNTLELVVFSEIISLAMALPMGVYAAAKKDQLLDHTMRVVAVVGSALPAFWFAMLAQYVFFYQLGWLPMGGLVDNEILVSNPIERYTGFPLVDAMIQGNWPAVWNHSVHLVMPVMILAFAHISTVSRILRTTMVESLHEDYVTAARSYGFPEWLVLWRTSLKNAFGPVATAVAMLLASMVTNTFLIETLFNWPGMGRYTAVAASALDFPVILAVSIVAAASFVVLNMIADIVLALDPRVRLQ